MLAEPASADFAPRAVDADDLAVQMQLDAAIGVELVGTERQPILGRAAGKVVFRQIRPVDRRRPLGAQHDDASLIIAPAQHLGCGKTGGAAANDHDLPGRWRRRPFAARLWLLELVGDKDAPVALVHLPARDRAQGRRPHRLSAAQIEAGVMPGTAHGVADDQAVRQRAMIMRAMGVDREHLAAAADQQNLVAADVAQELAVDEIRKRDALGQIRTARRSLTLLLCHRRIPRFKLSCRIR